MGFNKILNRRSFVCQATAASVSAMAVLGLSGCGSSEVTDEETMAAESVMDSASEAPKSDVVLQVFAANSLEKALPLVQELYTKATGVTFTDTQFKSSGALVESMEAQAPADVLIVASSAKMDIAEEDGLIDASSRGDLFYNDLIVVRGEGADIEIDAVTDVDTDKVKRMAIGDSTTVPAGKYANQTLAASGLYSDASGKDGEYSDSIGGKVVLADKVGTAANYVSTGDCDIAFVYMSDLYRYSGIEIAYTIPDDTHDPIIYPGAVSASTSVPEASAAFLEFCKTNPEASQLFSEYGFEPA